MTAASGFTNCACPCIQQAMNDVVGRNAPALRRDKIGMVNFLLSPQNTSGVEQLQLDSGKGKRKCVTINWYHRMCESSINESCTDDCSTGDDDVPYCEDIEVDNCYEAAKNFDEDDMRRICAPLGERDQDWIANIMNGMFNSMNVYLDKAVLSQVLANIGTFMDGSTIKAIQLFNTINSDAVGPRTRAIANIIDEFDQQGLLGIPNLVGANELNKFVRMVTYGVGNAAGQDVGAIADEFNFFYDRFLEGVFGANEFVALAPGVAHLVFWHKYVGDYQKANDVSTGGPLGSDAQLQSDEIREAYGLLTMVILSQASESHKSSLKVQRLTDEQTSNNSDTSVRLHNMDDDIVRYLPKGRMAA